MMKKSYLSTILACLGSSLEYYDFIIYGMMAHFFSPLFFPKENGFVALLSAYAIFAVGYLTRPLGGLFFGTLADTLGRKKAFSLIMLLMALSTFGIGCLPTFNSVGILAPLLLLFFRILQGLSFGAELPCAVTVVNEHADEKKRGLFSGFLISAVSLGSTLATFILYLLTTFESKEAIHTWAWRVPFLFGGSLAIVNFLIRKKLAETPEFKAASHPPVLILLKEYKGSLLIGMGLTLFLSSLVISFLYLPTFFTQYYHWEAKEIYFGMTCGMITSILALPFTGLLADRWGHLRLFSFSCLSFSGLGFFLFWLAESHLILFMVFYQMLIAFLSTSFFPLLTSLFPISIRVTGVGFCYNVVYSLMGLLPLAYTTLSRGKEMVPILLTLFSVMSLLSCMKLRRVFVSDY